MRVPCLKKFIYLNYSGAQRNTMGKKKSKKFWFLQNRPSVGTPLHVSGCEMAHFNTSQSKAYTCIGQPWYGQLTALKKGILWPVSHDCIEGSGIQLMVFKVFRWLVFGFQLTSGFSSDFKRWNQFAFYLRQNLNYLRKKTSLESFAFGSWLNLYIICDDYHGVKGDKSKTLNQRTRDKDNKIGW